MALGIGTSLYDPLEAIGEKKSNSNIYLEMLKGFSVNSSAPKKQQSEIAAIVSEMHRTMPNLEPQTGPNGMNSNIPILWLYN